MRTLSSNGATSLSCYSTESQIDSSVSLHDALLSDVYTSACATLSLTSDASSSLEVGRIKNTNVMAFDEHEKPYKSEVESTADSLGKLIRSPEELRYHLYNNSSGVTIISLVATIPHLTLFRSNLNVSKLG